METITVTGSEANEVTAAQSVAEIDVNSQPVSIVHVSIPNQPVQVQSVIQANQPSVIQTAGGTIQAIQVSPTFYACLGIVPWGL